MIVRWALLALVAACGRVDFDPHGDARGGDAVAGDSAGDAASGPVNVGNDSEGTNDATGSTITMTMAPTAQGHLLVVTVTWCCMAVAPTVTDNVGNTWPLAGPAAQDGSNDWVAIYFVANAPAGVTSITLTHGTGSFYMSGSFAEFANIAGVVDSYMSAVTTTATMGDSGPLSPTAAGDVVVAIGYNDKDATQGVPGTGYTLITPGYGTDQNGCTTLVHPISCQGLASEYRILGAPAQTHATFTWQSPGNLPVAAVAFR
jgi:hypothetical protein